MNPENPQQPTIPVPPVVPVVPVPTPDSSSQILDSTSSVNFPTPPPPPKKNLSLLAISIVLVIVALLATVGYFFWPKTSEPIACTEEAKICPDGSAVGRTGPKCEFAECPEVSTIDPTADWETFNMGNATFKYPQDYYLEPQSIKATVTIFSKNPKSTNNYYIAISEYVGSIQDLVKLGAIKENQLVPTKVGNYSGYELQGTAMPGNVSEKVFAINSKSSYFELRIWNETINPQNADYLLFTENVNRILSTFKFVEN